jgi:hypothetical protein
MIHADILGALLTPVFTIGGTIVLHRGFDPGEVWRTIEDGGADTEQDRLFADIDAKERYNSRRAFAGRRGNSDRATYPFWRQNNEKNGVDLHDCGSHFALGGLRLLPVTECDRQRVDNGSG